ncbi:MAG: carboxypeptidase-like regulatory domain-containing protein [Myxococcota bacterium]
MRALTTFLLCLLGLVACNPVPDTIDGQVVDIWGVPIDGATVLVVDGNERQITGPDGRFSLPRTDGTLTIKTGCKGYVQDQRDITVEAGKPVEPPLFELYPKPEETGFYAVGTTEYKRLQARSVTQKANALTQFVGLEDPGDVTLETRRPRILYHNDKMRHDQIQRSSPQMRRLEVPLRAGDAGTAGRHAGERQPVRRRRWPTSRRSSAAAPTTSSAPRGPRPGVYALQTQGLLSSGDGGETFATPPKELRVAFPINVK